VEALLGISSRSALALLKRLRLEGRLERVGRGSATRYRRRG
jgi:ATP-dependent DNA helicase RecG